MEGNPVQECICHTLKRYEVYCYQVAYYLLGSETEALRAAEDALLALGTDREFLQAEDNLRITRAKAVTITKTLLLRRKAVRSGS